MSSSTLNLHALPPNLLSHLVRDSVSRSLFFCILIAVSVQLSELSAQLILVHTACFPDQIVQGPLIQRQI